MSQITTSMSRTHKRSTALISQERYIYTHTEKYNRTIEQQVKRSDNRKSILHQDIHYKLNRTQYKIQTNSNMLQQLIKLNKALITR